MGDGTRVRTHSVREVVVYEGVTGVDLPGSATVLECAHCEGRWPRRVDRVALEQQPCGTRNEP